MLLLLFGNVPQSAPETITAPVSTVAEWTIATPAAASWSVLEPTPA